MKVKVKKVTGVVSREWANEFLKRAPYRRDDGFFYCEDCGFTGKPSFCRFVAERFEGSSEFCTYFEPKSQSQF